MNKRNANRMIKMGGWGKGSTKQNKWLYLQKERHVKEDIYEDFDNHFPPAKSHYECKKNRGDHFFSFLELNEFNLGNKIYKTSVYQCILCGKKRYEISVF